ncbi:Ankyrin repeat-containing protein [Mycena kentingensis (nom. inval.)]|nr:Ankyrin repeat-containing protein [Mycena kentingensis (nom. inval.)]
MPSAPDADTTMDSGIGLVEGVVGLDSQLGAECQPALPLHLPPRASSAPRSDYATHGSIRPQRGTPDSFFTAHDPGADARGRGRRHRPEAVLRSRPLTVHAQPRSFPAAKQHQSRSPSPRTPRSRTPHEKRPQRPHHARVRTDSSPFRRPSSSATSRSRPYAAPTKAYATACPYGHPYAYQYTHDPYAHGYYPQYDPNPYAPTAYAYPTPLVLQNPFDVSSINKNTPTLPLHTSESSGSLSTRHTILAFLFLTLPYQLYLTLPLLHIPRLYFARFQLLLEDTALSAEDAAYLASAPPAASALPAHLVNFRYAWDAFLDRLVREYAAMGILGALILFTISISTFSSKLLPSDSTATRTLLLLSALCALLALVFAGAYALLLGGGAMRRVLVPGRLAAHPGRIFEFWNIWIVLSLPVLWVTWSLTLLIASLTLTVWHPPTDSHSPSSPPLVSTIQIVFTTLLGLGVSLLFLAVWTFHALAAPPPPSSSLPHVTGPDSDANGNAWHPTVPVGLHSGMHIGTGPAPVVPSSRPLIFDPWERTLSAPPPALSSLPHASGPGPDSDANGNGVEQRWHPAMPV